MSKNTFSIGTDLTLPQTVVIVNKGSDGDGFVPYKQNFNYTLDKGESISFKVNDSEKLEYYSKQTFGNVLVGREIVEDETTLTAGKYNSASSTFESKAPYSVIKNSYDATNSKVECKVYGYIPYEEADTTLGLEASHRFTVKLAYKDVESRSDLPTGNIVTISTSDGSTLTYKRDAFEDDGSLIAVVNIRPHSIFTVEVKWGSTTTVKYEFTFYEAEFKDSKVEDVKHVELPVPAKVTLTNLKDTKVGYIPYGETLAVYINAGDAIVFTVEDNPEAVMYYLAQNQFEVTLEETTM